MDNTIYNLQPAKWSPTVEWLHTQTSHKYILLYACNRINTIHFRSYVHMFYKISTYAFYNGFHSRLPYLSFNRNNERIYTTVRYTAYAM